MAKKRVNLYVDTETGTRYIQKPSGLMAGRYGRKDLKRLKLKPDKTKVFRADGKTHKIVQRKEVSTKKAKRGLIFGRIPARGLAKASLSTRKRVSSMGGKARRR